jgi:cytochrome c biogenesis protein ResB
MRRLLVVATGLGIVLVVLGVVALTIVQGGEGQKDSLLDQTNRKFERLGFATSHVMNAEDSSRRSESYMGGLRLAHKRMNVALTHDDSR